MRIAVVSCWAYRDAWPAFFPLLRKYWPDCPYPITLLTDYFDASAGLPEGVGLFVYSGTWCDVLAEFAELHHGERILLFQEDFFLTHEVVPSLVQEAIALMRADNIGAVRLFPCPGATCGGTASFDRIGRDEAYRNSLQATIWDAEYLAAIARATTRGSAADFEGQGTAYAAANLKQEVMAFRTGLYPFPIQYMCSAISRGKWEPTAKELCDAHGITMDWSRGFRTA